MTQTGKDYGKELQVIRAMLGLPQAFPSAAVCVPPGRPAAGAAGAVVSHGLYGPRRGYMVTAADIHAIGAALRYQAGPRPWHDSSIPTEYTAGRAPANDTRDRTARSSARHIPNMALLQYHQSSSLFLPVVTSATVPLGVRAAVLLPPAVAAIAQNRREQISGFAFGNSGIKRHAPLPERLLLLVTRRGVRQGACGSSRRPAPKHAPGLPQRLARSPAARPDAATPAAHRVR